jgi:hypothetical protein
MAIQVMQAGEYKERTSAMCMHGMSPAVECLRNMYTCPCGYAEGLSSPNYPMPAIPIVAEPWDDGCWVWRADTYELLAIYD